MLTIKLELDKSKENYRAVMEALQEFDIVYASWGDNPEVQTEISAKSGQSGADLSSAVSAAVNAIGQFRNRPGHR